MSTLNGMAHLKDALFEYISEHPDNHMNGDLLIFHEKVIRVMKHLIKVYSLDVPSSANYNHTLGVWTLDFDGIAFCFQFSTSRWDVLIIGNRR